MFPLAMLPLPGERSALHVFEPRYKQLFDALEAMEAVEFCIVHLASGKPSGFASVMRLITVFNRRENGARDALLQCTRVMRLHNLIDKKLPEGPVPSGEVSPLSAGDNPSTSAAVKAEWVEWVLDQPDHATGVTPPETAFELLVEAGADAQIRAQVLSAKSKEHQNRLLLNWMRTARLIRQQERRRQGPIYPN